MFQYVVDSEPEIGKPLSAMYRRSFAYPTFKSRMPKIVEGIVQFVRKQMEGCEPEAAKDGEDLIRKITTLKKETETDAELKRLSDFGNVRDEERIYDLIIESKISENERPSWFRSEWLFAECYLYRRINHIFRTSKYFQYCDPFSNVKLESLLQSKEPIIVLCNVLASMKENGLNSEDERKKRFNFFLKSSLWGNKADLSLSGGKAIAANKDVVADVDHLDAFVLVDHTESLFEIFAKEKKGDVVVIDYVLDNAGYELYGDCCFADFLIWSGLAQRVHFHCKNIPWFVSDVTPKDFSALFSSLKRHVTDDKLLEMVSGWRNYFAEGKWMVSCDAFWTTPYDYSLMWRKAADLYEKFSRSHVVIFKGDLNYRKLMGDIFWLPHTPFREALRGFEPMNICALRTLKSDTISGLQPGQAEKIASVDSDWLVTGKYALVQLHQRP